jgi:hypothetical protein
MGAPPQPLPSLFPETRNGEETAAQLATEALAPADRERLYRTFTAAKIPENDPLWALVGVQTAILEPFVKSQPHIAALNKALKTLERAADRIDKRSQYLNLGWPLVAIALTAALCLGGMAWWHDATEKTEQTRRDKALAAFYDAPEGLLLRNLQVAKATPHFALSDNDADGVSHRVTITLSPNLPAGGWKLTRATLDASGNAQIEFSDPSPRGTPSVAQGGRHR